MVLKIQCFPNQNKANHIPENNKPTNRLSSPIIPVFILPASTANPATPMTTKKHLNTVVTISLPKYNGTNCNTNPHTISVNAKAYPVILLSISSEKYIFFSLFFFAMVAPSMDKYYFAEVLSNSNFFRTVLIVIPQLTRLASGSTNISSMLYLNFSESSLDNIKVL